MTQYAVLAYWEMSKVGLFRTSLESTERVANWLLRTQDPGGNWGYQGKEAEGRIGFELVKQDSARPGMAAAGLGATYMVADMLGLGEVGAEQDASLPPPRPLDPQGAAATGPHAQGRRAHASARPRTAAASGCRRTTRSTCPTFPTTICTPWSGIRASWKRPRASSSKSRGGTTKATRWLKKEQQDDGSWKDTTEGLDAVNTAFATLFLLRSTKKAIERSKSYGEGALLAGRGLPADAEAVRIRGVADRVEKARSAGRRS